MSKPRKPSFEVVSTAEEVKQAKAAVKDAKSAGVAPSAEQEDMSTKVSMDDHTQELDVLYHRYSVNPKLGIPEQNRPALLEKYGYNELTPPPQKPAWVKLLEQMWGLFPGLLWAGSILSLIGYSLDTSAPDNLYIGVVLAFVVVVTGIFSFMQEHKSSELMAQFRNMAPPEVECLVNGEWEKRPSRDLVPGDIVRVQKGDKVPCDIRIMECSKMKVDNSSLTGESEPQPRDNKPVVGEEDPEALEAKCLAFFGTSIVEGTCTGLVVQTGDETVIGTIANLAASTDSEETPIHLEVEHFIRIVSGVAFFLGITFLIISLIDRPDYIQSLIFMIGIIVANVPEGLLATVTVSLALTANRMAEKNVMVRNLEAVETLGSTTTICSDKTGTLTQNKMSVAHVVYGGEIFSSDTSLAGGVYSFHAAAFQPLFKVGALCSTSRFVKFDPVKDAATIKQVANMSGHHEIDFHNVAGDASETAILKFCEKSLHLQHVATAKNAKQRREFDQPTMGRIAEMRTTFPMKGSIPFSSTIKFQLHVHGQLAHKEEDFVAMKGAPERVLDRCSEILNEAGEPIDIQQQHPSGVTWRQHMSVVINQLASNGERVLGFAYRNVSARKSAEYDDTEAPDFPSKNLVFCGLMALIDPPRPGVREAVADCQSAGIKVVMVTGDHPVTARAIGQQVGIIHDKTIEDVAEETGKSIEQLRAEGVKVNAVVVPGSVLKGWSQEKLIRVLDHPQCVFARTSPQQKHFIVEACQKRREIVAVTGDGVNDSPALKLANIGIAMGIAGTAVSIEASDMVLMDDNFATIVHGVEEGRLIFDNLKKSIAYTLSSNIPEISPFLFFITARIPVPLPTLLILAVDLGTDMWPAISLAYETPESDIMDRPPRNADTDKLVTNRLISFAYLQIGVFQALAGFYTYFVVLSDYGYPPSSLFGAGGDWDKKLTPPGATLNPQDALKHAQTAYFVSIIVVQWADLLICKTRKLSMFEQGLQNSVMNSGIVFETALGCFLCYVPFCNEVFATRPIRFVHWLPGMPFSVIIFLYDETRKYFMRGSPGGWLERHTYY